MSGGGLSTHELVDLYEGNGDVVNLCDLKAKQPNQFDV